MTRKSSRVRSFVAAFVMLATLISGLANAKQPTSEQIPSADGGADVAVDGGGAPPLTEAGADPVAEEACLPACRTGYSCVHGKCVSACNPPCASNEVCTAELQCMARSAPATPPVLSTPVTSPPAAEPAGGVRTHDGFYFRIALGFGALFGGATITDNGVDSASGSLSAPALVGELSFGGTVGRGVVLGVGNWNAVPIDPTLKYRVVTGGTEGPEREASNAEVSPAGVLGPFIDWYPEPTDGFHVQFAGGLASGGYKEPGDDSDRLSLWGGGGMLGLGYEFWVGEQWSIGALARATAGYLYGSDPSDDNEKHGLFFASPSGLMTFTYH